MKYVFTGGGTQGHTNPAIAVAEEIRRLDSNAEILFFMREGGAENKSVIDRGFDLWTFPAVGLKKSASGIIKLIPITLGAIKKCLHKMREFKPDKVFGTGGYVSFAPLLSGLILKIPTYIHESNIIPGKVTRVLSRLGCRLLLNSKKTLDWLPRGGSGEVVGNPLLSDLGIPRNHARRILGVCDGDILIVSFGGSGGSKVMNNVILEVMQNYTRRNKRIKHIHATGKKYYDEAKTKYHVLTDGVDGCKALPYIEDMPIKLAAADIVIARCGAMTISEIAASGAASILIPSPNVTDNHQYENALHLTKQSAAIMIEEKNLDADMLTKEISILVNSKEKRNALGANISKTAIRDSANRISRILMG